MPKIIQIYGATGTTKSSLAQSSARTNWYAELDPGSFERSKRSKNSDLYQFHEPLTSLEDMGFLDTSQRGQSGHGPVLIAHRYTGWRETYWEFIQAYLAFLKDTEHEYGIIDTSTVLWNFAQNALRQRIQEEGGTKEVQSDRLKRLEYNEPNDQLMSIVKGAKAKKDLVLVAHRGEIWEGDRPTGRFKPDGWNKASDSADIAIMMEVRNRKPLAIFQKAGGTPLDLIGFELEAPTLDFIIEVVDAAKAIFQAEVPLPSDDDYDTPQERAEAMIKLAGML
jgi:hypothetical protein